MNARELQNEIIDCLWSNELKTTIAKTGHIFTGEELLGIAFKFATSFEERLRLMQLLVEYAPSVSEHAARCITWQKALLEQFKHKGDYEIYELRIKDEPDAYEERYLCESFDTALEMIDEFYKEYDGFARKTEQSCYEIEKRKILRRGEPFCEDGLGECDLTRDKVLVSVYSSSDETENGVCSRHCMECSNRCASNMEVYFPACVLDRAPVRYYIANGSINYGIQLNFDHSERIESCYIIPLDGEMLKNREYDKWWGSHWHEHIPCPYVETVSLETLDEEMQENYHAFVAWLDKKIKW